MKVTIIATGLTNKNGWDHVALQLSLGLANLGHTVQVITPGEIELSFSKYFKVYKLRRSAVFDIKELLVFLFFSYFKLLYLLRSQDVILASYEGSFLPAYLCTPNSAKFCGIIHGTYVDQGTRGIMKWPYARMYKRMDSIICVSFYTKKRFVNYFPQLESKTCVVTSGVEASLRNRLPFQNRKFQVLTVGAVKSRKGTLYAIRAIEKIPNLILHIVGDQEDFEYMELLKSEIKKKSLADRVIFHGKVSSDKLNEFFQESLALIMPSVNAGRSFEGFGLVHLEAYSHGTPSIGSIDSGNEEVVVDGHTGYLVPQKNEDAITNALNKIISDPVEWERLSKRCLDHAKTNTWEKTIQNYNSILTRPR